MKKLFKSIRSGNLEAVKQLIDSNPALVNCTAKQPPKKDDGQSPLQVAFKTGNTAIADYLIDMGADVNFIEDESCCNSWRTPVLHDAINCAVMFCRWNTNDSRGLKVYSTKERADEALRLLKKMIESGADVNALDSYGNSGLNRFGLQANQILPNYNYVDHIEGTDRLFTDELHGDLRKVLQVLKDAGADVNYKAPNIGYSVREFYREGSIAVLFDEVFG
ncbi:hypothetical protein SAMN02910456_02261 [Ruminococcaceae bacterium YRB3002]|nr:hypothetical protein SAMN02910456_02261 [Ruminococcaceae bacterium YRB3002]